MRETPALGRQRLKGKWPFVFPLALILVAFVLRLVRLGALEFGFDEAISASVSALGFQGILAHLLSEPFEHPPLYYMSLYAWQTLAGAGEYALRFYSVFWGVLFVALMYAFLRRLARSEALALLVALLAAGSPFLVACSQEARMYTLLPCLALLLLFCFHRALQRPHRPRWWLAGTLILMAGVATHYFFALIWLAATTYLLIFRPRPSRPWLRAVGLQAALLLIVVVWFVAFPGPRQSLLRVMEGEAVFGVVYKLDKMAPTLILSEFRQATDPVVTYLLSGAAWLLIAAGVWWSWRSRLFERDVWRLLVMLLLIPPAVSLALPYGVLGRHIGSVMIAGLPFMACGLLLLRRRGWVGLAVGAAVTLLVSGYGLQAQYTGGKGDLGAAMAFIDRHATAGDVLILNQPTQRPVVEYYNRKPWPVVYLPPPGVPITQALVDDALSSLAASKSRLWLGPISAWTADPDRLTEQWLTQNAFQALKVWFQESSFVALYFSALPMEALDLPGEVEWEGRVRLLEATASTRVVDPGDAIRVSLKWQAGQPDDAHYQVLLSLVDGSGHVWAERRSEPCGGSCPAAAWERGTLVQDRHALLVPWGTPPGVYRLQLGWSAVDQGRELLSSLGGQRIDLAQVEVKPAADLGPETVPTDDLPVLLEAHFGDTFVLEAYDVPQTEYRLGQQVRVDLSWAASRRPVVDYRARWELVGKDDEVIVSWDRPLVAEFYPTGRWAAGEHLRATQRLELPPYIEPGRYRLRLVVVDPSGALLPLTGSRPVEFLGGLFSWSKSLRGEALELATLTILDRPRTFEMPTASHSIGALVGDQVQLLGYDLDLAQARAGGEVTLTLYWRGRGATGQPYKVFTHVGDGVNKPVAQDDGPPGGGCCPTNTWVDGEIIVDRHTIALPLSVAPGDYWLTAGMYEQASGARLPVFRTDGGTSKGSQVFITQVTIEPAVSAAPLPAAGEMTFRAYFPYVARTR